MELTIFDKFGEYVTRVNIQNNQCPKSSSILLAKFTTDLLHDIVNLFIVDLQIFLHSLCVACSDALDMKGLQVHVL